MLRDRSMRRSRQHTNNQKLGKEYTFLHAQDSVSAVTRLSAQAHNHDSTDDGAGAHSAQSPSSEADTLPAVQFGYPSVVMLAKPPNKTS